MFTRLKDLFDAIAAPAPSSAAARAHQVQLATCVLLVEVMRAEPELGAQERAAVVSALRRKFDLAPGEVERLVDLAHETSRRANDFHAFTSLLNEHFSHEEKIRTVEQMWEVAFADGHLDAHENHLVSKVAGLLHVTHGEYIAAKLRAKESSGR